ncbi:MAG TPA: ABC transporter permease, partial [Pyrinomonadaceae bacterium]|nr:ABC transporter permease [Pyrinomonadaceae bacterium]
MMASILRDLKYGIRLLFKNPGFTIVVVLSLAVGIGVNATVFSVANAFLLKTLPVDDTTQLVYFFEGTAENPGGSVSYMNYIDYRDQNSVFSGLASYSHQPIFLTTGARTERIAAEVVSGNYFAVLGVRPVAGRAIQAYDDELGKPQLVAVVSQSFWEARFDSDPQAIGQQIKLNSQSFTIVGVAPRSFSGTLAGMSTDVWVPLTAWAKVIAIASEGQKTPAGPTKTASPTSAKTSPTSSQAQATAAATGDSDEAGERKEKGGDNRTNRDHDWLTLIGRMKPDVTVDRAQAELTAVVNRVEQSSSEKEEPKIVRLVPVDSLRARATSDSLTFATLALAGSVIVLLIACINVVSLVLSRATVRRNEIAIRLALGSSRGRLVRQLLTENMLLALLGGVAGLVSSIWATRLLLAFIPVNYARLIPDFGVDRSVVALTFLMSLATSMIFGLAPALNASKVDLTDTMKESGGGSGRGKLKLRNLLVVLQIAISVVMLVSAGLFFRSLQKGQAAGDSYKSDRLLLLPLAPRDFGYNNIIDKTYTLALTDHLSRLPGVQAVTLADNLPFDMAVSDSVVYIEGRDQKYNVSTSIIAPHYFDTFNLRLRGQDFTDRDDASAPRVAIINETMARFYWPNQDAIGKRIRT